VRVFLGCRIDADDATRVSAALDDLRRTCTSPALRWTPLANYHVTLRFFGELSRAQVDRVGRLVEPIAVTAAPIDCLAMPPQPFPSARRPKVIVLPIDSGGRLEQLAMQCNDVLRTEFGPPDKPFKAHLTVLRCSRGARFEQPGADLSVALGLTSMVVFESTLAHGGPRYTPLQEFRLGR